MTERRMVEMDVVAACEWAKRAIATGRPDVATGILNDMIDSAPTARRKVFTPFATLRDAVERLYFAAYWSADRPVDGQRLWEDVYQAAGFTPGDTARRLGPPR